MQIIIPMSGFGERFRKAGYLLPKPLIEVDGKPIIAHVIDMFPGEIDFIFICNEDHLANPNYCMGETLQKYCPTGKIVSIAPHKLGPIHAVRQAAHLIDITSPIIVNYCDFTCYWDWHHFKEFVITQKCDGAIPAYKGFHPHTLGSTNYAYMLELSGWVSDIQEKQPYTNNRMEEFASSGTYYFASGKIMNEAFSLTIDQELNINGEYYVSLAYKAMLAANCSVAVYPIQHFMQWGTPEDLTEYNEWSSVFKRLIIERASDKSPRGTLIVPMAGLGKRFMNEGYSITKPLISVSGKPMVVQATNDLPLAVHHVFVMRSDMTDYETISAELKSTYPKALTETIPKVTDGQACSALIGLNCLDQAFGSTPGPVTFGACDSGVLYDHDDFESMSSHPDVDILVWGVRGHANAIRHPEMFGWIDHVNGEIRRISVKAPLKSPANDPIVTGTFTFRRGEDFRRVVQNLIAKDERVNGEFYIDSCINHAIELGLRCHMFEVDNFISWGTPNDLRTFEYWQSCFHKWGSHPYRLELDSRVDSYAISSLEKKYQSIEPTFEASI